MSRKDDIKSLFTVPAETELPTGNAAPTRTVAGPVRHMGLVLRDAASEAVVSRASGPSVVELDPAAIDPAFLRDRFPKNDPAQLEELQASLDAHGQEVPVLVRPHPTQDGRFQAAYGHRRIQALRNLGRPVRAIVRAMTDQELIVAQGIENAVRVDLSWIERAVFASALEGRGFERSAILGALAVNTSELSRMLSVGRAIPSKVIEAIGAAPATGRFRWQELAELLKDTRRLRAVERMIDEQGFERYDSDTRLLRVLGTAAGKQRASQKAAIWKTPAGKTAAKISASTKGVVISFDKSAAPEFGEYIAQRLDELYSAFQSRQSDKD